MKHIQLYEKYQANSRQFIKRYLKSDGFLSLKSKKRLLDIGIDDKDLNRITSEIKTSLDFINDFDVDVFNFIIQDFDLYDEYPISYDLSYSLYTTSKISYFYDIGKIDVPVTQSEYLDKDAELEKYIIDIFNSISEKKVEKLDGMKKKLEDPSSRKSAFISKSMLSKISDSNYLKGCIINPCVKLTINLNLSEDQLEDLWTNNDVDNIGHTQFRRKTNELYTDMCKFARSSINRMLISMGCGSVNVHDMVNWGYSDRYNWSFVMEINK